MTTALLRLAPIALLSLAMSACAEDEPVAQSSDTDPNEAADGGATDGGGDGDGGEDGGGDGGEDGGGDGGEDGGGDGGGDGGEDAPYTLDCPDGSLAFGEHLDVARAYITAQPDAEGQAAYVTEVLALVNAVDGQSVDCLTLTTTDNTTALVFDGVCTLDATTELVGSGALTVTADDPMLGDYAVQWDMFTLSYAGGLADLDGTLSLSADSSFSFGSTESGMTLSETGSFARTVTGDFAVGKDGAAFDVTRDVSAQLDGLTAEQITGTVALRTSDWTEAAGTYCIDGEITASASCMDEGDGELVLMGTQVGALIADGELCDGSWEVWFDGTTQSFVPH